LRWKKSESPLVRGYRIHWRETTEPQWRYFADAGDVESFTLENVNIDNYLFGVSAVGVDDLESVVVFAR
jgi:hypothetical protein